MSRLRMAGVAAVILLVAAVVALVWNHLSARQAYEELVARLTRSGEPMSLEALRAMYPPVSGTNAADAYLEAAQQLPEPEQPEALAWLGAGFEPGDVLTPEQRAASIAFLEAHADARALLSEAAATGPCRFPLEVEALYAADLRHLTEVRGVLRFLMLEAAVALDAARPDDAARAIEEGLLLTARVLDEPVLVSRLVADAMLLLTLDTINHGIRLGAFERLHLERAGEALHLVEHAPGVARVLRYERGAFHLGALEAPRSHPGLARVLHRLSGVLYRDLRTGLLLYGDLIAIAQLPEAPARLDAAQAFAEPLSDVPGQYVVSRLALANAHRWVELEIQHAALVEATRVSLAAEAARLETGRLPDGVGGLLLEPTPLDPATGEPLRYRIEDTGFVVYSAGANRADDGGELLRNMGESWREADYGFRVAYSGEKTNEAPTEPADASE
jgi:hypothetical protein